MQKALESRRSAFAQSTQKEIELSHLEAQAYHALYKCSQKCYEPLEKSYYEKKLDLACESNCHGDFAKLFTKGFRPSIIKRAIDEKEACMTDCFIPRKGNTDQVYCMEKCS